MVHLYPNSVILYIGQSKIIRDGSKNKAGLSLR